jgi:hypothetical protein
MKKTIFCTMLIAIIALAFACKSQPQPSEQTTDDAFKNVYDRYRGDLILDGAGTYTVVRGDTLSKISRAQYNNGFYFPIIMLASSDIVLDPDKIEPGMELTIPDLQRNLNDAKAKVAIKKFLAEVAVIEDLRERPADAEGLRKLSDSM